MTAEQDYDAFAFGRDEAEEEYVLASAIVAFWRRLSQWRLGMEGDFLVTRAYQMQDDVRRREERPRVAEPRARAFETQKTESSVVSLCLA